MENNLQTKDCLKIIQLTDTHLFGEKKILFDVDCNQTFEATLNKIIRKEIHDTDLVFLTGDISQDETLYSYRYLLNAFKNIKIPVIWIPGNHDNADHMQTVFKESAFFHNMNKLELKNWIFIFLNTQLEGAIHGSISQNDLQRIKEEIKNGRKLNKKIALIMHHHPFPVGTPLIDQYIINNKEELWDCIKETNVEVIICGHVHGDYQISYNNISIESGPATCFQFKKGSCDLDIEKDIGYKIHYFDRSKHYSKSVIWDASYESY